MLAAICGASSADFLEGASDIGNICALAGGHRSKRSLLRMKSSIGLSVLLYLASLPFGIARAADPARAGDPLPGLTNAELTFFANGQDTFAEVDSVGGTEPGADGVGLGPRFNMNSCAGCHAYPSVGGS